MDFTLCEGKVGNKTISYIKNDEFIGRVTSNGGEWDSWMRNDVMFAYKPGTDIIDIGGNIGCNALLFSDYGPVHTFDPLFHSVIQKNVDQNVLKNPVKVYPFALSSTEGQKYISVPRLSKEGTCNYGACSFNPHSNFDVDHEILVDVKRLDDVYSGKTSFIKIDAELHEMEVLKGAENTILENKPALLVEVHVDYGPELITEYLKSLGYSTYYQRPDFNRLFVT